jgi:hypothetical protein
MKNVNKLGYGAVAAASAIALSVSSVFAQEINADTVAVSDTLGDITGIQGIVTFVINLFYYLGWVGVVLGVGLAIFGLIYKLINTDSEEAMKTVQSYLTKAVLIVVAGILLISSGWIINTVAQLFGVQGTIPDTTDVDPNSVTNN